MLFVGGWVDIDCFWYDTVQRARCDRCYSSKLITPCPSNAHGGMVIRLVDLYWAHELEPRESGRRNWNK